MKHVREVFQPSACLVAHPVGEYGRRKTTLRKCDQMTEPMGFFPAFVVWLFPHYGPVSLHELPEH
jgi:hypothetical protein